jgi:hypothetical protein
MSGQLHAPAALPSEKAPTVLIGGEDGRVPELLWTRWKNSCPFRESKPDSPARSLVSILSEQPQLSKIVILVLQVASRNQLR